VKLGWQAGVWAVLVALAAPAQAEQGMVLIPAGPFIMGSNRSDTDNKAQEYGSSKPWYLDEKPQRELRLPAYWIDQYEITNAQYREFVRKANYWVPPAWRDNGYLLNQDVLKIADLSTLRRLAADTFNIAANTEKMDKPALLHAIEQEQKKQDMLPVTTVNWLNATDYCRWAGKRLPSEAEWEKAARGRDGREYPWGNEWGPKRANAGQGESWEFGVAPVGSYPAGVSPYGVHDMAGNVMEWTQDWYEAYPGSTYVSPAFGKQYKVVRGGGWGGMGHYAIAQFYRSAYRLNMKPDSLFVDIGFRCVKDAE